MKTSTVNFKMIFLATCAIIPIALLFLRAQPVADVKRMPRHSFETVKEEPSTVIDGSTLGENIARVEFYEGATGSIIQSQGLIMAAGDSGKGYATIVFKQPVNLWDDGIALKYAADKARVTLGFTDDMRRPTSPDERVELKQSDAVIAVTLKSRDVKSMGLDKSRIVSMEFFVKRSVKGSAGSENLILSDVSQVPNRRP